MLKQKPLFSNIFGESNTLKVLDFLFMGEGFDFTLTHIHNGTKLSRTAIRNAIEKLEKADLVEQSREDSKSKYYHINKDNNKYPLLKKIYRQLQEEVIAQ